MLILSLWSKYKELQCIMIPCHFYMYYFTLVDKAWTSLGWRNLWWICKNINQIGKKRSLFMKFVCFEMRKAKFARIQASCQPRRWMPSALLLSHNKVAGTAASGSSPGLNLRGRKTCVFFCRCIAFTF